MTDQLGPYDGVNAVTERPDDTTEQPAGDFWFAPCSSPTAQDGTQLTANTMNRWVANIRALWRGAGALISGSPVNPDTYSDSGLLAAVQQLIQRGQTNYAVDTGAANALVVNPTPPLKEYKAGIRLTVVPTNALTAAAEINVSGLGEVALTWADGQAFTNGDWPAGAPGQIECTGATWVLLGPVGPTVFGRASLGGLGGLGIGCVRKIAQFVVTEVTGALALDFSSPLVADGEPGGYAPGSPAPYPAHGMKITITGAPQAFTQTDSSSDPNTWWLQPCTVALGDFDGYAPGYATEAALAAALALPWTAMIGNPFNFSYVIDSTAPAQGPGNSQWPVGAVLEVIDSEVGSVYSGAKHWSLEVQRIA
jgi:hypothetical protein